MHSTRAVFSSQPGWGNGRSVTRGGVIFSQGDPCDSVMYIRRGAVQLSVLSQAGREAIVGTLGAGDFLGESALAGRPVRQVTASNHGDTCSSCPNGK